MTSTAEHRRLLGVSPQAGPDEIRAAYRAKLRRWHPDVIGETPGVTLEAATDMTARLNRAYEQLSGTTPEATTHTRSRAPGPPTSPPPARSPRRARRPRSQIRDLTTIGLGGVVAPLIGLLWASGVAPVATPALSPLVACVCAADLAATVWLLYSTRFLRRRPPLGRAGALWIRVTRLIGWVFIAGLGLTLGIPALVLLLTTVAAAPFFGLVFIAAVSGRSDSRAG